MLVKNPRVIRRRSFTDSIFDLKKHVNYFLIFLYRIAKNRPGAGTPERQDRTPTQTTKGVVYPLRVSHPERIVK